MRTSIFIWLLTGLLSTGPVWAAEGEDTGVAHRVAQLERLVSDLQRQVRTLQADLNNLDPTGVLTKFSRNGNDVYLDSANLHIRNGLGATDMLNPGGVGLGNVIIGYNELRGSGDDRSGSHMLVLGKQNNYTSFGGIIAGVRHSTSGEFASVTGGQRNWATGRHASVSGGVANIASGESASVSGGSLNRAIGDESSISGGNENRTFGGSSWIGGGETNFARGGWSTVIGGQSNEAVGNNSTISGGECNSTTDTGRHSKVGGGRFNVASGEYSTVSGGNGTTAAGQDEHPDTYTPLGGSVAVDSPQRQLHPA
jgi:hypothetical protein